MSSPDELIKPESAIDEKVNDFAEGTVDEIDKLPDEIDKLPDEIDKLPDEIDKLPDEIDKLPDEIDKLPDEIDKLPDEIDNLPDEIDKLHDEIDEVVEKAKEPLGEQSKTNLQSEQNGKKAEYVTEEPLQEFKEESPHVSRGSLQEGSTVIKQQDLLVAASLDTRPQEEVREFPPHTQEVKHLFKPKNTRFKTPIRWDPIDCELCEGGNDEFEMSTAMRPVYDDENPDIPKFKNGEPDYNGEFLSCFGESNLLYRIHNREEKIWAFYNDTRQYEMHVQFIFGKHSKLEPLDNTTMHINSNGEYVAEVFVYPGETERFIKGTANGFTSKLRAVPLTDAYYKRRQELAEEAIQEEIDKIKAVVGEETDAEKVLQACVENGLPFVDLEFPPRQASLDTGAKKVFKPLPWARPASYVPQDMVDQIRLFRGTPRLSGIEPGELGDNWLMCSVATVLEQPQGVFKMFRHPTDPERGKKERAVGGYRVTFNKNGLWRSVIVDNYLPISGGQPKYARSQNDLAELWPSILQKAFAKLHGSYGNICSGDPLRALQDLTGYPSFRFDEALLNAAQTGKDTLFHDWVLYTKANYRIILSTPGKDAKDDNSSSTKLSKRYRSVGLLTGHAYTVLSAKYFPEHELRLVKIRNAWGRSSEWSGDWCDDDEKWEQNPDVARACDFQKADDGTFWMTWEATLHYFNGGGVLFAQPTLNDYRIPSKFVNCAPSCVLEINVEQPTRMCFTISQHDKRCRQDAGEYQPVMLSIAHPFDNDFYKVVQNSSANAYHPLNDKWTFFQARDVSIIYKLLPEKSPYIVIPRLMAVEGQADEVPYVLGISCNRVIGQDGVTVQFKTIDKDNRVMHNFPKFEPETMPVAVEYQAKLAPMGFPDLKTGSTIC